MCVRAYASLKTVTTVLMGKFFAVLFVWLTSVQRRPCLEKGVLGNESYTM